MRIKLSRRGLLYTASIIVMNLMLMEGIFADVDLRSAVGIWLFDEGGGNSAKDLSEKKNHGKLVKSPKWVKGKFSDALKFAGKEEHVVSSSNVGIPPDGKRSIVFWFKPAADKGRQSIVTWGAFKAKQLFWVEYNGYKGAPNNIYAGGFDADAYTEAKLTLNKWHHVAVVHPGLVGETKIYYDGISQKMLFFGGHKGKLETPDTPVGIGFDLAGKRQPLQGGLDEVAIFSDALTEGDVKEIRKKGFQTILAVSPRGKLAVAWGKVKTQ